MVGAIKSSLCLFENDRTQPLSAQLEEWLKDRYGAGATFIVADKNGIDLHNAMDFHWEDVCASDGFLAHWIILANSFLPTSVKVALVPCDSSLVGWKVYMYFPEQEWEGVLSVNFDTWIEHEKYHLFYGNFNITSWHQNKILKKNIPSTSNTGAP